MEVTSATPRTKGVNGIQSWMLGCTVMVIAALSEYGVILFIKFMKIGIKHNGENQKMFENVGQRHNKQHNTNITEENFLRLRSIDLFSLIAFPIAFSIFTLAYFFSL